MDLLDYEMRKSSFEPDYDNPELKRTTSYYVGSFPWETLIDKISSTVTGAIETYYDVKRQSYPQYVTDKTQATLQKEYITGLPVSRVTQTGVDTVERVVTKNGQVQTAGISKNYLIIGIIILIAVMVLR